MKTTKAICLILLAFIVANLLSCTGFSLIGETPYGTVHTNPDGTGTYTPPSVPITFPIVRPTK